MASSLRAGAVGILVVASVLAAGCHRTSGSARAPTSCVNGNATAQGFRTALAHAPGAVRLADGTRISDCLAHDPDSGDLQQVGSMLLSVAQQVAASASGPHDQRALVELGYLTGAVHRGAARAQGVDGEIERRIEQETSAVDTGSTAFREGERAGRTSG